MTVFFIPAVALIVGIILLFFKGTRKVAKILIFVSAFGIITIASLAVMFMVSFVSLHPLLYIIITFVICAILLLTLAGILWGFIKKKMFYIPICIIAGLCLATIAIHTGYNAYVNKVPTVSENNDILESYSPYVDNTKVATLDEPATLQITEDIPRMNGATALYPVYSAFARAVYPKYTLDHITNGNDYHTEWNYLSCNNTTYAYEMIVDGDADIIFVAGPSKEQELYAEQNGVELVYTPIGREAFVFFVNARNPIENITVDEIKGIYSGKITHWTELGVEGMSNIKAFQRNEGSGSQSTLQRLMGDTPIVDPPTEDVISGMGGIIEKTADYKNYRNAIGYSFRFYSTEMVKNDQIKLLSINGVYPDIENIENETYPLTSYFYAVTRSDVDENTKELVEWILSPQGQELIEKTGYTPIYN